LGEGIALMCGARIDDAHAQGGADAVDRKAEQHRIHTCRSAWCGHGLGLCGR